MVRLRKLAVGALDGRHLGVARHAEDDEGVLAVVAAPVPLVELGSHRPLDVRLEPIAEEAVARRDGFRERARLVAVVHVHARAPARSRQRQVQREQDVARRPPRAGEAAAEVVDDGLEGRGRVARRVVEDERRGGVGGLDAGVQHERLLFAVVGDAQRVARRGLRRRIGREREQRPHAQSSLSRSSGSCGIVFRLRDCTSASAATRPSATAQATAAGEISMLSNGSQAGAAH
mmetsp:Transcript_11086/g.35332  ORF Transcript_11086/g.35332 Transcript_11086/m.35332 type:complete len:232 (+) Transcript_11086:3-698(+)